MRALHRSPAVVGTVAAVVTGGLVHHWLANRYLSVAVGLLYFAGVYFDRRVDPPNARLRGLPLGEKLLGTVGLVATVVAVVGSAVVLDLAGGALYTYVLVVIGASFLPTALVARQTSD